MPVKEILSILAGVIYVGGYIPYIRAILQGETKPSKTSWLIWAALDSIIVAAMLVKHTVNGQILGAVTGSWIVVALAMKHGEPGWTMLDKFCLGGAALGLLLWQTFQSPVLGVLTSLIVMIIGSIPTFVSAWKYPEHEDRIAWTMYWFSCVIALIAIPRWTILDAAQPCAFTAIESVMMYLLWLRPLRTPHMPFILLIQIPPPPQLPRDMVICQRCFRTFTRDDVTSIAKHTCVSTQPHIFH